MPFKLRFYYDLCNMVFILGVRWVYVFYHVYPSRCSYLWWDLCIKSPPVALEIPGFNPKKEKHHLCMGHIVVHCQVTSNNESVFQRSLLWVFLWYSDYGNERRRWVFHWALGQFVGKEANYDCAASVFTLVIGIRWRPHTNTRGDWLITNDNIYSWQYIRSGKIYEDIPITNHKL